MENFKNFLTTAFLMFFCVAMFFVAKSNSSQIQNLELKSYPDFKLEFSGIVKVIDGDSIRVDNKEVRLFGVDAPEFKQTCFDAKNTEYECGKKSFYFLLKLAQKKNAKCLYSELDKYNRFLAKCFINETSINDEIIKNGMGVIYDYSQAEEATKELEALAKEKKLGIWQGAFELPKDYRKKHPRN